MPGTEFTEKIQIVDADGHELVVNADGSINVSGSGVGVSSVYGRSGAVVAVNGDYAGVVASALTGATAATRYVGGTASVAPVSGTFAVGDFVITQAGKIYICTVAGTPGTWVLAAGGGTVTGVTAADTSITIGGTAASPTVATGTVDVIATNHPPAADWSNNSKKITAVADPISAQDAATKNYVDGAISGVDWKAACDLATQAALPTNAYANGSSGVGATLTGVSFGALAVDGVTVTVGMRILVKNEAAPARNGIYVVSVVGAVATLYVLTRATDFDQSSEILAGDATFITAGSTNADTSWVMTTTGVITVGTTAIAFAQFGAVVSVTAADGSIVIGGTASAPTVRTGTLDVIATQHPPAAAVAMNAKKITGLGLATASTDAASLANTLDQFGAPAANVPWNSKKITGLAAGAAAGEAAIFDQITRVLLNASLSVTAILGADGTGWDFQSIPATYNHLELHVMGRLSTAAVTTGVVGIRFNNDSASYNSQLLQGAVSSAGASSLTTTYARIATFPAATAVANRAGSTRITIPCYAQTTFHKTGKSIWHGADSLAGIQGFLWPSTVAISRITIIESTGANFLAGSAAYLYGLL